MNPNEIATWRLIVQDQSRIIDDLLEHVRHRITYSQDVPCQEILDIINREGEWIDPTPISGSWGSYGAVPDGVPYVSQNGGQGYVYVNVRGVPQTSGSNASGEYMNEVLAPFIPAPKELTR